MLLWRYFLDPINIQYLNHEHLRKIVTLYTGRGSQGELIESFEGPKRKEVTLPPDFFPDRNCNINSSLGLWPAGLPYRLQISGPCNCKSQFLQPPPLNLSLSLSLSPPCIVMYTYTHNCLVLFIWRILTQKWSGERKCGWGNRSKKIGPKLVTVETG